MLPSRLAGRTSDFESENLGSYPSTGTNITGQTMDPNPASNKKPEYRNPNAHISIRGILTAGTPPPLRANRNDKCPCGSNKKYKKCCLGPDQNWGHDDDGKLLPARVLAYEAEKRLT
jgi:hypothetical protein